MIEQLKTQTVLGLLKAKGLVSKAIDKAGNMTIVETAIVSAAITAVPIMFNKIKSLIKGR